MPRVDVLGQLTLIDVNEPVPQFIAACVEVRTSTAAALELEVSRTTVLRIQVVTKPRMKHPFVRIEGTVHTPTVCYSTKFDSGLTLEVFVRHYELGKT